MKDPAGRPIADADVVDPALHARDADDEHAGDAEQREGAHRLAADVYRGTGEVVMAGRWESP